ncbi:MAG: AAA family ATPase [Prevotellaceae bacterium]|nr:AAA family ATPase [Candidatus Minthosoma caballi]
MKFFDRTQEIARLHRIEEQSLENAQFTVVSGRRRIGKTMLVREAYKDKQMLYFFVTRRSESELCAIFAREIEDVLGVPVLGMTNSFADVFRFVMELAKRQHVTLMIDEFQEFYRINPSVYSSMQEIWDRNKQEAKINLIVCGSVNSLLNKIFKNKKEPLFGRQTDSIHVRPFAPSVLKDILSEYKPDYTKEDLLALYTLTGGVAKYVEMFVDKRCMDVNSMLQLVFEKDSYFIAEGKSMLIEEFGRDYGTYFSILSLIAQGHNTRAELEDILKTKGGISGYLKKLTDDYELVTKHQPLFEKSANKSVRYAIHDRFLHFWFRYIYKYDYVIEAGANKKLMQIVANDYTTYSGKVLEEYFLSCMTESEQYTRLGYWQDRNGKNEIDIVGADDLSKRVEFVEVKRQASDLDMSILRAKADVFLHSTKNGYGSYEKVYKGLCMEDM